MFAYEQPTVDVALQAIKENIFVEIPVEVGSSHQCSATIQQWMDCYNLDGEIDDYLTNFNIPESEDRRKVE